jgi:uncharacterized protein
MTEGAALALTESSHDLIASPLRVRVPRITEADDYKMSEVATVVTIGLAAGILGGFFGVGGGVLIVPALVLLLGMSQHQAVGTSLGALLPPVGLLGAYEYYRHGNLNIAYAIYLGVGLLVGAYLGAIVATQLSGLILRRAFAIFLMLIAIRLLMK